MSKIELTEQELFSLMFNMWHESKTIMNHVHCWKIIKDKIQKHKAKDNEVLDTVINCGHETNSKDDDVLEICSKCGESYYTGA